MYASPNDQREKVSDVDKICFAFVSMFGVTGGIVLIAANRTYHNWILKACYRRQAYKENRVVTYSKRLSRPGT